MRRLLLLLVIVGVTAACTEIPTVAPAPGEVWRDATGSVVPAAEISLYASGCAAWPGAGFLEMRYPLDGTGDREVRRYVRDPEQVVPTVELYAPYDARSALSRDARFTGLQTDRFLLYIGADHETYVYLVDGPRVEALPRAEETLVCP